MSDASEVKRSFEGFELAVAILLGLAALGTSWVGYQAGLWGGKMSEAYSEAAKMTSEAGALNGDMLVEMSHDENVDIQAKILIAQGRDADSEADRDRAFELASYLYLYQLSDDAYASLGLPAELKTASGTGAASDQEDDWQIAEEALYQAFDTDLDDVYYEGKFKEVTQLFDDADEKFEEGRQANEVGDKFELAGVIFTAALFFAGLSLVFKTSMRWGFLGVGAVVFLAAVGYMLTLPTA